MEIYLLNSNLQFVGMALKFLETFFILRWADVYEKHLSKISRYEQNYLFPKNAKGLFCSHVMNFVVWNNVPTATSNKCRREFIFIPLFYGHYICMEILPCCMPNYLFMHLSFVKPILIVVGCFLSQNVLRFTFLKTILCFLLVQDMVQSPSTFR